MPDLQFHEIANIFPLMSEDDFDGLVEDIRKNGQLEDCELFEGKILDGRNRYRACLLAGVDPRVTQVNPEDPVSYVVSKNLHRRQLTPSQVSMVGDTLREIFDLRAKERQKESIKDRDEKGRAKSTGGNSTTTGQKARDEAGKAVGVSGSLIDHARKVRTKGTPELVKAVEEGRMSVSAAAKLTAEDAATQNEVAEAAKFSGGRYRQPKKPKPKGSDGRPKVGKLVTDAISFAKMAISDLERIKDDDPQREDAFTLVERWLKKNRSKS